MYRIWKSIPCDCEIETTLNRFGAHHASPAPCVGGVRAYTGRPVYALTPPTHGAGLAWWAPNLFNVVSISQSQGIDFQMRYILDDRYRRIDFDIPERTWALDNVNPIDKLA